MAFENTILEDYIDLKSGEVFQSKPSNVESYATFENGLLQGRFCKYDTGSLDNLDASATPVIAGVSTRDLTQVSEKTTYDASTLPVGDLSAQACDFGFVTVDVTDTATPAKYGAVYAVNAATAEAGKATDLNTQLLIAGAIFWEAKSENVWVVRLSW